MLTINNREAMAADAHHQMILSPTFGPIPVMMAGRRKPADISRIDRANQRVLFCMREDRSRNDEHILSGKAFPEFQRLNQRLILA